MNTHTDSIYLARTRAEYLSEGSENGNACLSFWQLCTDELTQSFYITRGVLIVSTQTLVWPVYNNIHVGFSVLAPTFLHYQSNLSDYMTPTIHRRFLSMGYAAVSQSLSCSTRIRNAWPVHRAAQFGMLTFSFSPLFPRMLPRHSLLFHSTSFNFLTGAGGASPFVFPAPLSVLH